MTTIPSARAAVPDADDERGTAAPAVEASRALAWLLVIAGAIGFACSVIITIEKINLLENPHYVPSCNLNPVIACGSVMSAKQAGVFGFPNPLIGIGAFAVVVTIGAAMLAGARFRGWFWLGLQAGTVFGIGFIHWLMFQTLYRIDAVCPYCSVVWTMTIALFWYTLLHNLKRGVIPTPASWQRGLKEVYTYHWVVPVLWYAVIALLILNRFWYYWQTQL